ncbi:aldose 1-epimerase family protein [Natronosporangium hydrolyticum]|uniref:Aldose 1-epimerase family protein n=1 Tax=Natronosporangium hydrolyticum TaxID=2811111 RepID=A0A895YGB4_9ACTN|nr:aldose 1-epimerase family protein [Natronosporangium hydrolyticum]QSB14443.1 aldose 1-epimerase family protein [Natronosporangium hydrolyticum]
MADTVHPSGSQWTISDGAQEAVIVEVGGGLRTWRVGEHELLDGYAADELCPGAAGQILAPWPNRIRDGRYPFAGTWHQLPVNEPEKHTALHGLVRWLPWRLTAADDSSITVECVSPAQPGYPWTLAFETVWSLAAGGLTATHRVTNWSAEPAPFGFSVHPYLRLPGVAVSELRLHVPARSRLLADSRLLPIGAAKVDGTEWDFTTPRRIGDLVVDVTYGSVIPEADGTSAVTLSAEDGAGVRLWADASFPWWQLYSGDTLGDERQRRSVALEPMTCPPDAFRSGRDVIMLAPGETWEARWGLVALSSA